MACAVCSGDVSTVDGDGVGVWESSILTVNAPVECSLAVSGVVS